MQHRVGDLFDEESITVIFSNMEQIQNANKEFLDALRSAGYVFAPECTPVYLDYGGVLEPQAPAPVGITLARLYNTCAADIANPSSQVRQLWPVLPAVFRELQGVLHLLQQPPQGGH